MTASYTARAFLSPSDNVSCQFDTDGAAAGEVYCQSGTPPQSVTMGITGTLKECHGVACLGNAGEGTPTLAYGSALAFGAFTCTSAPDGITCMVHGRGFRIARTGITQV